MIFSQESVSYRAQFLLELQQTGAIHSFSVANAFAAIPREPFVPLFYKQQGREWVPYSKETQDEPWLGMIYQDEALVTLLDAQNIPISSSSQPSLMAAMLEALDVQPGNTTLEIGTGTGYNAALLSQLTGDPRLVTTIEMNRDLVTQAEQILHEIVGPVTVIAGNGYAIAAEQSYDRIIATASAPRVPHSWYRQLSGGGRLVMPLMGSLNVSGFLIIEKGETQGVGHFLPIPLGFMPMRSSDTTTDPTSRELFQLPIKGSVSVDESSYPLIEALAEPDFRWFLEWAWPSEGILQMVRMTLQNGRRALLLKDPRQRTILQLTQEPSGNWCGQQHGEFPLWQRICRSYQEYQELGRPGKDAYQMGLNAQQAYLSVRSAEEWITLRENLFDESVTRIQQENDQ